MNRSLGRPDSKPNLAGPRVSSHCRAYPRVVADLWQPWEAGESGSPISFGSVAVGSRFTHTRVLMANWPRKELLTNFQLLQVLALLVPQGFVMGINGVAAPWIMGSFGLEAPGLARLFAGISIAGLVAFLLARLFDLFGRGRMLRWNVAIGSASAAGAALSVTTWSFIIFQTLLIASASAAIAAIPAIITEMLDPSDRAMGQGLGGIALGVGGGLCLCLMPVLNYLHLSWRWLPALAAVPGVAVPWVRGGGFDDQFWRPVLAQKVEASTAM